MRVGPENSVYSIFVPRARATFSVADEKIEVRADEQPRKSEAQLLAEHYERAVQQILDSDDTDEDGLLSKDEWMAGQIELANADHRFFDRAAEEERWAKFDPEGKGAIGRDEIIAGLKAVLPMTAHYITPEMIDRMKQAEEADRLSKPDFEAALKEECENPSIARNIRSMIAEQASGLSLFGEGK